MSSPTPFRARAYVVAGVTQAAADRAADQHRQIRQADIADSRRHLRGFRRAIADVQTCAVLDARGRQRAIRRAAFHGGRWQEAIARLRRGVRAELALVKGGRHD